MLDEQLRQRFQKHRNRGVVAKRFADVREAVYISWPEDEASAKLKRISSKLVLLMTTVAGTPSGLGVIASQEMQEIRGLQFHRAVGLAGFVDQ